jgi:hypothetical protein
MVGEEETGATLPIAELKTQGGGKAWARVVRDGGAEIASAYAGTAVGSALLASSDVRVGRHGVSAYLSAGSYSGSSSSGGAGAGAGAAAGGRGRGRGAAAPGRGRGAVSSADEDSDSGRSDDDDGVGGGAAAEEGEGRTAGAVSGRKRGRPQRASRAIRKRYTDDAAEDDSDAEGEAGTGPDGEGAAEERSDGDEGAGASSASTAAQRGRSAGGKSAGKKGFRTGANKRLRKAAAEEASDSDGQD